MLLTDEGRALYEDVMSDFSVTSLDARLTEFWSSIQKEYNEFRSVLLLQPHKNNHQEKTWHSILTLDYRVLQWESHCLRLVEEWNQMLEYENRNVADFFSPDLGTGRENILSNRRICMDGCRTALSSNLIAICAIMDYHVPEYAELVEVSDADLMFGTDTRTVCQNLQESLLKDLGESAMAILTQGFNSGLPRNLRARMPPPIYPSQVKKNHDW